MSLPALSVVRRSTACALVLLASAACSGLGSSPSEPDPAPSGVTVEGLAVGDSSVTLVAAGDIARRPTDGTGTAALIESVRPDAVLALGDNAYESGTPQEYVENYDPSWGQFKSITRPIPGNHEYETEGAAGYFAYFRSQIHDQPYYAWDAGRWRLYALNCDVECGRDSRQLRWLVKDLAKHPNKPKLAYVHEPFYTCSTRHPPALRLDDMWQALQDAGGQVMLSGNNHAYERFAPMDIDGRPAPDGLRQFVVGTGGASLYPLVTPCENRDAATDQTHGVLRLDLKATSYRWQFLGVDGTVVDSGKSAIR